MTLYATTFSLGLPRVEPEYLELTPDVIRDFLENAVAFEKIGFSPQVIADLVVKCPTVDDRINSLKKKYHFTDRQGLLVQTLPFREASLYFDKHEYFNQVKRLKTLQQLLQEMQDVLDK